MRNDGMVGVCSGGWGKHECKAGGSDCSRVTAGMALAAARVGAAFDGAMEKGALAVAQMILFGGFHGCAIQERPRLWAGAAVRR